MTNLTLSSSDRKQLNAYQHAKIDPATRLVWIEDGTAGVSHSAHPNVEANKYSRKDRKFQGYIESHGFLFSPDVFTSTDLDKLAAKYCSCVNCKPR